MAEQDPVATALSGLDPNLATVLKSIVSSTAGISARVDGIEKGQEEMRQNLQGPIDRLSAAVAGVAQGSGSGISGASVEGGAAASGGIEHMFARAENMEDMIKRQIEQALAGANSSGAGDPFTPVRTEHGEFYTHKVWAFGTPVKLSRDAHREVIFTALDNIGFKDFVLELDARDSSSLFHDNV